MGVDTIGRALAILRAHTSSLDIVRAAQDVVEMLAATEARAVSAEAEVAQMESKRRNVIDGLIADVAAARRERDTLAAEVKRLRDALADRTQGQTIAETAADVQRAEVEQLRLELEKPVAGAWVNDFRPSERGYTMAAISGNGWVAYHNTGGKALASGPETSDAGRHAADLALLAAGYRLVGGAHPLPSEVPDAR